LRDDIEKLNRQSESKDNEIFALTKENLTLRDKIELLENIIQANKADYDKLVSAKVISSMEKSTFEFHGGKSKTSTIDSVY